MNNKILILTDKKSQSYYEAPCNFDRSCVTVTSASSIKYIGFFSYSYIVFDYQNIPCLLNKVALGIKDSPETEALWHLCAVSMNIKILCDKKTASDKNMFNLGIDYILPSEIRKLCESKQDVKTKDPASMAKTVLTADDIRLMHHRGEANIPPSATLTSWASELAETYQMNKRETMLFKFLKLNCQTKSDFLRHKTQINDIAEQTKDLCFIIPPPLMVIFNEIFPSLKERKVSPTIHWASKGAFTGEVAAEMLKDVKCNKAIIPANKVYAKPENLKSLIFEAQKNGIDLFSTFSLALHECCDIISWYKDKANLIKPVYPDTSFVSNKETGLAGAVIVQPSSLGLDDNR